MYWRSIPQNSSCGIPQIFDRKKSCAGGNRYPLPLQLTPPGTLTAHRRFCLVLLRSRPDTVRRFLLRKTQTSSPLTKGSYTGSTLHRISGLNSISSFVLIYNPLYGFFIIFIFKERCLPLRSAIFFYPFSSFLRSRIPLKKSFSIRLHSSSRIPLVTFT